MELPVNLSLLLVLLFGIIHSVFSNGKIPPILPLFGRQFFILSLLVVLERSPASGKECPRNIATFTCLTDTGFLRWFDANGNLIGSSYTTGTSVGTIQKTSGFTLNLTASSNNNLTSTAKSLVPPEGNVEIQCSDGAIISPPMSEIEARCKCLVLGVMGEPHKQLTHGE